MNQIPKLTQTYVTPPMTRKLIKEIRKSVQGAVNLNIDEKEDVYSIINKPFLHNMIHSDQTLIGEKDTHFRESEPTFGTLFCRVQEPQIKIIKARIFFLNLVQETSFLDEIFNPTRKRNIPTKYFELVWILVCDLWCKCVFLMESEMGFEGKLKEKLVNGKGPAFMPTPA
ncbi:hypothetical protein Hanom_Chr12g01094531 [Helianthus anomalus]